MHHERIMVKNYIAGLLLWLLTGMSLNGQGCSYTFSGVVYNKHDNQPLDFVLVHIQELNVNTYTDEKGFFSIPQICPGYYHISLTHLACATTKYYIHISGDLFDEYYLDHHHHLLEEIRFSVKQQKVSPSNHASKITTDNLNAQSGKTLANILTLIPGVTTIQSGPGLEKPMIQGLTGNRILLVHQGIPLESQQWGIDHAPEIDPNGIDQVTLITNGGAVRYGMQAQGGVILTDDKIENNDPHWHGNVKSAYHHNGRHGLLYLQTRKAFSNSNLIIKSGIQGAGDQKTPDYYLTNTGFHQASGSVSYIKWKNTETWHKWHYSIFSNNTGIFRGAHIGNLSDLEEALNRKRPFFVSDSFSYTINAPQQKTNHHLLKYSFSGVLPQSWKWSLHTALQLNHRREFDIRRGERSSIPSLDLFLFGQFSEIVFQKNNLEAGGQIKFSNNVNKTGTGILPLMPDYYAFQTTVFASQTWKKKNVFFDVGARIEWKMIKSNGNRIVDTFFDRNFLNLAFHSGLRTDLGRQAEYLTNITFIHRSPDVHEFLSNGLHQGIAGIEEGNPNLKPESSAKWTHEWKAEKSHHRYFVSAFVHAFHNYIYLKPSGELRLTIRGAFPVYQYIQTDVFLTGLSGISEWEMGGHSLWVNKIQYTYANDIKSDSDLVYIPPLRVQSGFSHSFVNISLFHELNLGVECIYTSKSWHSTNTFDLAPPPGDYFLANASVKMIWKTKSKNDLSLLCKVENIGNVRYRDYLNRLRYFADNPGTQISFILSVNF